MTSSIISDCSASVIALDYSQHRFSGKSAIATEGGRTYSMTTGVQFELEEDRLLKSVTGIAFKEELQRVLATLSKIESSELQSGILEGAESNLGGSSEVGCIG